MAERSTGVLGRELILRPRIGTGADAPPTQLMTLSALLYGLSTLARYHPATWIASLDLNNAETAVHLGHGLDVALEEMPRLLVGALTGRAIMQRMMREEAEALGSAPPADPGLPDEGSETAEE